MGRDKRMDAYIRSRSREKVRLEEMLHEETGHDQSDHDLLRQLLALDDDEQRRASPRMSPDFS